MSAAIRPRRPAPALRAGALLALLLTTTCAACRVPEARAAVAPEARPVLERYVQAMGGQAFLEERSFHVLQSLDAFGMKGLSESWLARPDRTAERAEIGPLKLRSGYDGQVAWRTDVGGKVLRLDGKDLEDARAGAWFDAESWLLPDQGGGQVAWVGEESDSAGRYQVLEMTPPVGKARRLVFDAKSGLLVRQVAKNDQQSIVTRFSDFRRVGGRMMSFRSVTEVAGQPMNTIRATVDSVWVNEELPATLFALPAEQGAGVRYLGTPGRARLPYDYRAWHVWLKASVNGGPPADFIYDTGASITVIDSAYAARIGLKTEGLQQGQGAGATGSASFARLDKLTVAGSDGDGVEFQDVKVAVLNVNTVLAPYFWRDCAGVLGFDFVNRFVNELDYDGRVLTLYDPASFHYQGQGTAVPMTLAGHTPVVKLKLDGALEGDFRVDVGSGSTVDLHTPYVKEHDLVAKAGRTITLSGGGFGGTFETLATRMKKLEIGPFSWTEPLVSLSQAKQGALASEDYAGNIGNRLLERFKVTLDYERRQMWLEPGRLYPSRDPFSRSGAPLARVGDRVEAMMVLPGSPAAKAGLRSGDVVTAIDGKPVSGMSPDDVYQTLDRGAEGSRHTLDIVRDGRPRRVKIKLAEML